MEIRDIGESIMIEVSFIDMNKKEEERLEGEIIGILKDTPIEFVFEEADNIGRILGKEENGSISLGKFENALWNVVNFLNNNHIKWYPYTIKIDNGANETKVGFMKITKTLIITLLMDAEGTIEKEEFQLPVHKDKLG